MKKIIYRSLVLFTGILATSVVYAGTINFNQKDEYEFFYCAPSAYSASDTAVFDTMHILASGFCGGQPHVLKPGHIKGLPVDVLNTYYFQVKKEREFLGGRFGRPKYKEGSIDYGITNGRMNCYHQSSPVQGRMLYSDGHTFC